ncbi:MAG: LptF/LptG family permease [Verrucomicrobiae bacterium]|nr:LptF/LptG family permease [Verrucomicrobiae bacterium]
MKVLYRYLLKDVLKSTVWAVAILTFLLVLGNMFTRVFDLLINNDVPFGFVAEFVTLLIPFSFKFTLPWGLLIAVLLKFGRMSADQELVALRANGVSLITFSTPVLLLALFFCLLSLLNNFYLAPYAYSRMKKIVYTLASESPTSLFNDDTVVEILPGKRLYVDNKEGDVLQNLYVWDLNEDDVALRSLRASRGKVTADETNNAIVITLYDARMEERNEENPDNLSLIQTGRHFEELPLHISLERLMEKSTKIRPNALDFGALINVVLTGRTKRSDYDFTPILTEIQSRVAGSLSCLTFVLAAIPLAVRFHRRETSAGIGLSFLVVFVYYSLMILAKTFENHAGAYPDVLIWVPNLLFQALGLLGIAKVGR